MNLLVSYEKRSIIIGGIAFLLSVINSLTFTINSISLVIASIETIIVALAAVTGRVKKFIIFYLLFSSTTIESSLFTLRTHTFDRYSFFRMPFMAYYHLFFLMVILYLLLRFTGKTSTHFKNKGDFKLVVVLVLGFVMTFVTYMLNDNGVYDISGMLRFSIIDAYETIWLLFYAFLIFFTFDNDYEFAEVLKEVSIDMMIGISFSGVFLYLIGNFAEWTLTTQNLICPLAFFYSPALMLLLFERKHGLFYFLLGFICTVIQIQYTVGIPGAFWLYVLIVGIVFYLKLFKIIRLSAHKSALTIFSLMLIIIIPVAIMNNITNIDPTSSYTSYKLTTLLSLLSVDSGFNNWYLALGESIGIRIEQIINVFIELKEKPWALLFGKGFGGTCLKYWGIYNWNDFGSVFPDLQIIYRVYSSFLTGIVEIIINFGLIGIYFLFWIVKNAVMEMGSKNGSWMYILGSFWLLIFLYFYNSMAIGLIWFCIGLYEIRTRTGKVV